MLTFLYTRDYDDSAASHDAAEPMLLHVRVFTLADRNFIEPLSKTAAAKFKKRARRGWDTPSFAEAISELYACGPGNDRALHDIVLQVVQENADQLFGNAAEYKAFHTVIDSVGDFAADVARSLAGRSKVKQEKKGQTYRCPSCMTVFQVVLTQQYSVSNITCPRTCYGAQTQQWWSANTYAKDINA